MRAEPQITLLLELSNSSSGSRCTDFQIAKLHLMPLARIGCVVTVSSADGSPYAQNFGLESVADVCSSDINGFVVKAIIVHAVALRLERRAAPEKMALIANCLEPLFLAGFSVAGVGNTGRLTIFGTPVEMQQWMVALPSGYPATSERLEFCPYPRTS